ncbi:response regulator [Hyalangium rubrum]|uniref:Response regulator n=1 Tax=Hyalangium rubrum TaxID=3103134 RepID=A0ABU5GY62_9BACT|nr:response regulator [Hyalangium sp. s54d21]MDY7226016.1 response regulator [Hyalangium sp. s54d21]
MEVNLKVHRGVQLQDAAVVGSLQESWQAGPSGSTASRGASTTGSRRSLQELAPAGSISVLVIDDEPDMREMLSFSLPSTEFEVVTADGGRAAVELLGTRRFDVAITDLKMPGMNGVETVSALRQLDPDMEVIVATGYASLETALACMKHGAYDYIRKPYDIAELRHLIMRAVEKRRLRSLVPLYEVSCALLSLRTRSEVLTHLGELTLDLIPHQAFRLLLPEPGTDELSICNSSDGLELSPAVLRELARRAIDGQEPVSVTQTSRDWPFATVSRLGAALAYSLQVGDAPAGCLILLRGVGQPLFSISELQRGSLFAAQLALALETARLNGELEARVKDLEATREELVKAEKLAAVGKLAAGLTHELSNPLAFTKASFHSLSAYSRAVNSLWTVTRDVAAELARRDDPHSAELARKLLTVGGAETETSIQDAQDAAADAVDGIRRVEELLIELRALSGGSPVSPVERVDVVALLGAWKGEGTLPRPVRVEDAEPIYARVGRGDLQASLGRILDFLCETPGARDEGAPALVLRVGHEAGRPCIWLEDPLLELSEALRAELFDPRIQVDARRGRTMRLNLGLALAWRLLSRMGADLSVTPGAVRGTVFRLMLPATEQA